MTHSRREFLRRGLVLGSTATLMPGLIVRAAYGGTGSAVKNLILVELEGGNDGLNTLVPFGVNGGSYYTEFRPTIGIAEELLLKINGTLGFNPGCVNLKSRYDAGQVAIVQGVGYPSPNFSHEISKLIWAKGDPSQLSATGWIARLLNQFPAPSFPHAMTASSHANPTFLQANEFTPAFGWLGDFQFPTDNAYWNEGNAKRTAYEAIVNAHAAAGGALGTMSTTSKSLLQLIDTVDTLPEFAHVGAYPEDDYFADRMKMVARLMNANLGLRIFQVTQWGFDTHSEQEVDGYHTERLRSVFDSVDAFLADMAAMGKLADTVVVVYSEFGRTVYENGSIGTDHGTVAPVFVIGAPVAGGVKNSHPPLDPTQLDEHGEPQRQADFRDVFAEIGTKLYGVSAATLFPGYSPTSYGVLT
jgi:uncharacterized protein (DUF1501 family)